jgi:hypothetical protein
VSGALRRPCGSRGLQCRSRSPRVETRVSSAAKATPTSSTTDAIETRIRGRRDSRPVP